MPGQATSVGVQLVGTSAVGCAAAASVVLSQEPVLLAAGALAAVLVVTAVGTGWRWLGSVSVGVLTALVAGTAAAEPDRFGAASLVGASAVLLAYVAALDHVERPARSMPRVAIFRGRPWSRLGTPALALAAAGVVAAVAVQPVVPSIWLVLLGLAAGVGALVLATRSP